MERWLRSFLLNEDIQYGVWIFLKPLSDGLKGVFNKRASPLIFLSEMFVIFINARTQCLSWLLMVVVCIA